MTRTALLLLCVVACSKGKSDEELLAQLTEQKPLELPLPDGTSLQRAPVIVVTTAEISYQGRLMASVDDVVNDRGRSIRSRMRFRRRRCSRRTIS